MGADSSLTLTVTLNDVRDKRFADARDLIDMLIDDKETVASHEGKLLFNFSDLSEDGSDPGDNPDIREWFEELDRRYPFLAYFLSSDASHGQIPFFTSMLVPFSPEGESIRFDRQRLVQFALEKIKALNTFCTENSVDPRQSIRRFCEALQLDVIEQVVEDKAEYPFDPEKITSEFLIDFFKTGYYFHTIDPSDEPVLFALVDDPSAAYYAETELKIDLYNSAAYPVILLDLTVFDIPESPLKMTFVYNVDLERHRDELYAYSEMAYITTNFLFKENDELYYGFTRAIDLSDSIREGIRGLILEASAHLRTVPKEARNFTAGVEEFFSRTLLKEETESQTDAAQKESEPASPPTSAESEAPLEDPLSEDETTEPTDSPEAPAEPSESDSNAESERGQQKFEFHDEAEENGADRWSERDAEPEILQEIDVVNDAVEARKVGDNGGDQRRVVHSSFESNIPTSVLPESIQRITRALSKPVRRPATSVTEQLAVEPAPKRVVLRNEDQVERLSRRLLIMQNKLEQVQRENLRMVADLNAANEEGERLRSENLALESRWWKFWR